MCNLNRYFGYFWILFCLFCCVASKIVIHSIIGNSSVEVKNPWDDFEKGQTEFVLDCDYTATPEEQEEVKWFFNGMEEQIYQWIPDVNSDKNPSVVSQRFSNHIAKNYSVMVDGKPSYRALKLVDIDPTLSGKYTCKVTSDYSEHTMSKHVVIYSPAVDFQIDYYETVEVIFCTAENVAPKPEFGITIVGKNGSEIEMPTDFEYALTNHTQDGVYYNMSAKLSYNSSFLPNESVVFMCRIHVSGTNYTEIKVVEQLYNETTIPENFGTQQWPSSLFLFIFLVFPVITSLTFQ